MQFPQRGDCEMTFLKSTDTSSPQWEGISRSLQWEGISRSPHWEGISRSPQWKGIQVAAVGSIQVAAR